MARELEWNAEVTKRQHTSYVQNSRAVTVVWFVFTACYTILNIVAFIQPYWIGDTTESPGVGYFGLFEWCERIQGSDYVCQGKFLDLTSIKNDWWRASSVLVGLAALLAIFSIIAMLLYLFLQPSLVLNICGSLQMIAAAFIATGCIVYPKSFENETFKRICGPDAKGYFMDKCQIRWTYILAIVLIFDAFILAVLAFVLAARQAKIRPEFEKVKKGNGHKNLGFSGSIGQDLAQNLSVRQRHNGSPSETAASQQNTKLTEAKLHIDPGKSIDIPVPVDNSNDSANETADSILSSSSGPSGAQNDGSQSSRSPSREVSRGLQLQEMSGNQVYGTPEKIGSAVPKPTGSVRSKRSSSQSSTRSVSYSNVNTGHPIVASVEDHKYLDSVQNDTTLNNSDENATHMDPDTSTENMHF